MPGVAKADQFGAAGTMAGLFRNLQDARPGDDFGPGIGEPLVVNKIQRPLQGARGGGGGVFFLTPEERGRAGVDQDRLALARQDGAHPGAVDQPSPSQGEFGGGTRNPNGFGR